MVYFLPLNSEHTNETKVPTQHGKNLKLINKIVFSFPDPDFHPGSQSNHPGDQTRRSRH